MSDEIVELSTLLNILSDVYNQAISIRITGPTLGLLDALQSADMQMSWTASRAISELGEKLNNCIIKDGIFFGGDLRMLRSDKQGAFGFYPHVAGQVLLRRALTTGSPKEAILWFKTVLGMRSATGNLIRAIWGLPIEQEIKLTDNIRLVNIDNVPASSQKLALTDSRRLLYGSSTNAILNHLVPQSALMMAQTIEPLTYNPENISVSEDAIIYHNDTEVFDEIVLVLTLLGPRLVLSASQWFSFDDESLNNIVGSASSSFFHEITPSRALATNSFSDLSQTQALVSHYFMFNGKERPRVRAALSRLNMALCRCSSGDKALEICIAIEAILADKDDKMEKNHKIKIRAARLLGGNIASRKENSEVINCIYSIRSELVHSGTTNQTKKYGSKEHKASASEMVDRGARICAEIIKIIILNGSIPDWHEFDIL